MKNAYDYLVKNDIISKNMKGEISIKCYALDGREIYNGLNDNAIKKLKGFIDRKELKEKINKLLSKEFIDSLYNDSRQEVTFRVTEKKEEILKLLEE